VLLTLITWVAVSIWTGIRFQSTIPATIHPIIALFFRFAHLPWMLFWLWGVHNFWHQTLSLLPRRIPAPRLPESEDEPVALLYATCDDFDPDACQSCFNQIYRNMRLIICDDSWQQSSRDQIDQWVREHAPGAVVVRRKDRRGFKAGNLNYAIGNVATEEFIVVCDADEVIPPDFVANMLVRCSRKDVAFVQARHIARKSNQTNFSRMLAPTIDIYNRHSLPLRNRFGFVACFGHGIMIRRSAWTAIDGFPEIVSEDLGFAARLLGKGMRGVYAEEIVAEEAFPPTYTSFMKKYRKIVGGTIEFFQLELVSVLRSGHPTFTEKVDLLLTFSFCFIGLITMLNIIGGLLISHLYMHGGYSRPELGVLLFYMLGPLTPVVPMVFRFFREPVKYGKYSFSAAIAYASLMPVFAKKSIEQMFHLKKADFEVTGKIARQPQVVNGHSFTVVAGLVVLVVALLQPSPALVPAIGVSTMFVLAPLLCFTENNGLVGALARNSGIIPYAAIAALLVIH
jgi:glycosyltransferase involved in cell wall biosynthesis